MAVIKRGTLQHRKVKVKDNQELYKQNRIIKSHQNNLHTQSKISQEKVSFGLNPRKNLKYQAAKTTIWICVSERFLFKPLLRTSPKIKNGGKLSIQRI